MEKNFESGKQRCGFYDEDQLPHDGPSDDRKRRDADDVDRCNREDPSEGIKQLTTGFLKRAERYLSQCPGKNYFQYQVNRIPSQEMYFRRFGKC